MNRKSRFTVGVLVVLLTIMVVAPMQATAQEKHPLAGQTIDMSVLGIGGWVWWTSDTQRKLER